MASIENRSNYKITVKHRDDLTQTFGHNARKKAEAYCDPLKSQGLKPKLSRLDNYFVVRTRSVSNQNQTLVACSEAEANDIKQRLESEQRQGLFINYALATGNLPGWRPGVPFRACVFAVWRPAR
jgi:hypothetical protein